MVIVIVLTFSSCTFEEDGTNKMILETGIEADELLYHALRDDPSLEGVKEAVDQGANVNELAASLTKENVLKYYSNEHMGEDAQRNHTGMQIAQYLLEHGADPNYTLPLSGGTNLLMYCCGALNDSGGGVSMLFDLLLDAGADVNQTNSAGHSALYYAIRSGEIHRIERLISAGSVCGEEELEAALTTSHDSPNNIYFQCSYNKCRIAKTVLENFAETHHALIRRRPDMAVCLAAIQSEPDLQVSELLLKNAYSFEEEVPYTAGLLITGFCSLDTVQTLEQSGCVLSEDHFHAAASFGNAPVACYLQEKLIPLQDALSAAVQYGQPGLTQTFMERMERSGTLTREDHAVLDELLILAAISGNPDVVKQIYDFGAPYSPAALYDCLRNAIYYDALSVLEYLANELGCDVTCYPNNYNGCTLLEEAILHGNEDIFRFLLRKSDLEQQDCSNYLYSAVAKENYSALEALLALGLDPNAAGGRNPLWEAVRRGDLTAAALLVEYGADVNYRLEYNTAGSETKGYTYPIHEAARGYSARVLTCLLDAGARLDLIDSDGRLPRDMTMQSYAIRDILESEETR